MKFGKKVQIFSRLCAKSPPSKREATIFVPSSRCGACDRNQEFVRMKRGSLGRRNNLRKSSARPAQTRLQRRIVGDYGGSAKGNPGGGARACTSVTEIMKTPRGYQR